MKIVATPFPQAALIALEPKGDERGFFLRSFDRDFFSIHEMPVSCFLLQWERYLLQWQLQQGPNSFQKIRGSNLIAHTMPESVSIPLRIRTAL